MFNQLDDIKNRFDEINKLLSDPEITSDIKKITELSKEQATLREKVEAYDKYLSLLDQIKDAESLLKDPELKELAESELKAAKEEKPILEKELELLLLPVDHNDEKNVIVEIRGAAGGDEANIFAGNLFRMYSKYAENNGMKLEVLNSIECDSGGFSQIEFILRGERVYSKLKYESGSHRVQRVPKTESQGRVHTSTATVLVMPEAEEVDIDINPADLKIDVYRSSGAGGQCVNTTDSAVRITHLPTNLVVTCQNERSQIKNREVAMKILKTRLYEEEVKKQEESLGAERKNKVGSGDRSEKIRTYNYPQNRVTDHRIGFTTKQLDRVMDGDVSEIIEALINEDQRRKLKGE